MSEKPEQPTLAEIYAFLLGSGPLMGCWFGDDTRPPLHQAQPFWWRKYLREAIARTPAPLMSGENWQPIETAPMDGRWLYLLGCDGSDFESENAPLLNAAIRWRTKWIQPRDEERFELVEGDLYRRTMVPQGGYWWDIPGQLEYVYAWQPDDPPPPSLSADDPIFKSEPLDTRGDDFDELRRAAILALSSDGGEG